MFSDEMLIKIFADKEIQTVPIGCQATVLKVVERVLEEVKEENPYATLSDILSTDE